ncbi:hypothetical protein ACOTHZ_06290 [Achromobacter xylosoxidans]
MAWPSVLESLASIRLQDLPTGGWFFLPFVAAWRLSTVARRFY